MDTNDNNIEIVSKIQHSNDTLTNMNPIFTTEFSSNNEGWVPETAKFHSGNKKECDECRALLHYSHAKSWNDYLSSHDFSQTLQDNLENDAFVSSLICGDNYYGDLPVERRIDSNRRTKFYKNINDFKNMLGAGILDDQGKAKTTVHTLEELLITSIPIPPFAYVLQRRLAVILHAAKHFLKITNSYTNIDVKKKIPVAAKESTGYSQLNYLAISTLSTLLQSIDLNNINKNMSLPFDGICNILSNFPICVFRNYWSMRHPIPEKQFHVDSKMLKVYYNNKLKIVEDNDKNIASVLDSSKTTYWLSPTNTGFVKILITFNTNIFISSLVIQWNGTSKPNKFKIYVYSDGEYQLLSDIWDTTNLPEKYELYSNHNDKGIRCQNIKLELSGYSNENIDRNYSIINISIFCPAYEKICQSSKKILKNIESWMLSLNKSKGFQFQNSIQNHAFNALKSWCLATGALSSILRFIQMISDISKNLDSIGENWFHPEDAECKITKEKNDLHSMTDLSLSSFYVSETQSLIDKIESYQNEQKGILSTCMDNMLSKECREIKACFDSSISSSGISIENNGMTVKTLETSYQHAVVNFNINKGRAFWVFRLDNDTTDDEMTCFGAAILPVTISGYDSSPSLWMLRGYNGNLYARGQKLSKTIGKVHPGDIVTIEVDMTEGTLSFSINDNSYGVVFTDLSGHEIYPAISFYGTGKCITLLKLEIRNDDFDITGGIEKNQNSDDISSSIQCSTPQYLCNMMEYDSFVGLGILGRGNLLGYDPNNTLNGLDTANNGMQILGATGFIRICNENKHRSLSLHPPCGNNNNKNNNSITNVSCSAYVSYDLSKKYKKICGSVAINDSVSDDLLISNKILLSFSIYGDKKLLWCSEPISQKNFKIDFQVDVRDITFLELRVTNLSGYINNSDNISNGAQAVFVDPYLLLLDNWHCLDCGIKNLENETICVSCKNNPYDRSRDKNIKSLECEETSILVKEDNISFRSQEKQIHGNKTIYLSDALENKKCKLLRLVAAMGKTYLDSINTIRQKRQDGLPYGSEELENLNSTFDQPFCIEPSGETFSLLVDLLKINLCHKTNTILFSLIQIVNANFRQMGSFVVSSRDLGFNKNISSELRNILEKLIGIPNEGNFINDKISSAASLALLTGLPFLYPNIYERTELFYSLVANDMVYNKSNAQFELLCQLIKRVSLLPCNLVNEYGVGGYGVSMLFPNFNEINFDDFRDQTKSLIEHRHAETINKVLQILIGKLLEDFRSNLGPDDNNSKLDKYQLDLNKSIISFLKTYQDYLLSQVIKINSKTDNQILFFSDKISDLSSETDFLQFSVKQYGHLLLSTSEVILKDSHDFLKNNKKTIFNENKKEVSFLLNEMLADNSSIIKALLPSFVSSLCLLRRQCWLATGLISNIKLLLRRVDHICNECSLLQTSERRLKLFLFERNMTTPHGSITKSKSPRLINIFTKLYTGEKDHFEGQIGFQFLAKKNFFIAGLGRSVNPLYNNGSLLKNHTIRLWEEKSQLLIGEIMLNDKSPKDELGYVYEKFENDSVIGLQKNHIYRITSYEYSNSGDPWYKKENLPDEEYKDKYITLLKDCYNSGSTGYPSSQNVSNAAYGVPTFLIHEDNPLDFADISSNIVLENGTDRITFNKRAVHPSITVGHRATICTSETVSPGRKWMTAISEQIFVSGVHRIEYIVKNMGNENISDEKKSHSCSICIGLVSAYYDLRSEKKKIDLNDEIIYNFLGYNIYSIGWMPMTGYIWFNKKKYAYNRDNLILIKKGDTLGMTLNMDEKYVSFTHNGINLGKAPLNLDDLTSYETKLGHNRSLPSKSLALIPSLSICSGNFPDNSKSCFKSSQTGFTKGCQPVIEIRAGGISGSTLVVHWFLDLFLTLASLSGRLCSTLIAGCSVDFLEEELQPWLQSKLLSGGMEDTNMNVIWDENIDIDYIFSWLENKIPDQSILRKLGTYRECEKYFFLALVKLAPFHISQEVILVSSHKKMKHEEKDFIPSKEMEEVWKQVIKLRHWLIKSKHLYKAKECDADMDVNKKENKTNECFITDEEDYKKIYDSSGTNEFDRHLFSLAKIDIPDSFESLLLQICSRAKFLCKLSPPSEERHRLGVSSQLAIIKLTEKWENTTKQIPFSLEPLIERWKSLSSRDARRWSGLVNVLKAQHEWRTRKVYNSTEEDESNRYPDNKSTQFFALLKACDLYVRHGIGAPPDVLSYLLKRRKSRAELRILGFDALYDILRHISLSTARHEALIFLRPALRGFTDAEKESRESADGAPLTGSYRGTVRHHYLKGLEGSSREILDMVQKSFENLYSFLIDLLKETTKKLDSDLACVLMGTFAIDFEPRDHQFLLRTSILKILKNCFCITSLGKMASCIVKNTNNYSFTAITTRSIFPASYIRQELISGRLTKRELINRIFNFPEWLANKKWLKTQSLSLDFLSNDQLLHSYSISSLYIVYDKLVDRIKKKIKMIRRTKNKLPLSDHYNNYALQIGSSYNYISLKGNERTVARKAKEKSFVLMPELGKTNDFCIEIWLKAFQLNGYSTIRSDIGFELGSLHFEFVDCCIQVAINGNEPREVRFHKYRFIQNQWYHIAISYSKEQKKISLFVYGNEIETLYYDSVVSIIHFREAHLGIWKNGLNGMNTHFSRNFNGMMTELRIWSVYKTQNELLQNYQKVLLLSDNILDDIKLDMPLLSKNDKEKNIKKYKMNEINEKLMGLWHLDRETGDNITLDSSKNKKDCTLTSCFWIQSDVPIVRNQKILNLDHHLYSKFLSAVTQLQKKIKSRYVKGQTTVFCKLIKLNEEYSKSQDVSPFNNDEFEDNIIYQEMSFKIGSDRRLRLCSNILFRLLAISGICGSTERSEVESLNASEIARIKRKQVYQQIANNREISQSIHDLTETAVNKENIEKSQNSEKEKLNRIAQSAASSYCLEEPILRSLWFSAEFQRKVFDIVEQEVTICTSKLLEYVGFLKGQKPVNNNRSLSTPTRKKVKIQRNSTASLNNIDQNFCKYIEPLEIEKILYEHLIFLFSISNTLPAYSYIRKNSNFFDQFFVLLRIGSPRIQRLVLEIFRSLITDTQPFDDVLFKLGINYPSFIEFLLDRIAQEFFNNLSEVPISPSTKSLEDDHQKTIYGIDFGKYSKSLFTPVGYGAGDIQSVISSETVNFIHYLMTLKEWRNRIQEILLLTLKNALPYLINTNDITCDVRCRTLLARASGALSVLGSNLECLRVGGDVKITMNSSINDDTQRQLVRNNIDIEELKYSMEDNNTPEKNDISTGKIIEINQYASHARVVFESSSTDSDPTHNVQELSLLLLTPIEEPFIGITQAFARELIPLLKTISSLNKETKGLWLDNIRCSALLALKLIVQEINILDHVDLDDIVTQSLVNTALTATDIPIYIKLDTLEDRARNIFCRLIEASFSSGDSLYFQILDGSNFLNEKKQIKDSIGCENKDAILGVKDVIINKRHEMATNLSLMGFDYRLCCTALEKANDNPTAAVEWLMDPSNNSNKTETLDLQDINIDRILIHENENRKKNAQEISDICGFPYKIIILVLEIFHDDPNLTMSWLMDHGIDYSKNDYEDLFQLAGDPATLNNNNSSYYNVDNTCALEGIDSLEPILPSYATTSSFNKSNSTCNTVSRLSSSRNDHNNIDESTYSQATLVCVDSEKIKLFNQKSNIDDSVLSHNYTKNMLVSVSMKDGPVKKLSKTGILIKYEDKKKNCGRTCDRVLVRFLDQNTGFLYDEWFPINKIKYVSKLYGNIIENKKKLYNMASDTTKSLTIHYARKVIIQLFHKSIDKKKDKKELYVLFKKIGGPKQFLNLVKLVVAADVRAFFNDSTPNNDAIAHEEEHKYKSYGSYLLTDTLRRVMLDLLQLETEMNQSVNIPISFNYSNDDIDYSLYNNKYKKKKFVNKVSNNDELEYFAKKSDLLVSIGNNESNHISFNDEISDGMFLSLKNIKIPSNDGKYRDNLEMIDDTEEESKLTNHTSDSIKYNHIENNHLSTVLVHECIKHFIETSCKHSQFDDTKVNTGSKIECQSLHPYILSCDYMTKVLFPRSNEENDSSFHLKIEFDKRCDFFPKSSLTFYSLNKSSCKSNDGKMKKLLTLDSSSSKPFKPLIINSNEFIYHFLSSYPDDTKNKNKYGYRFIVSKISDNHENWTKENHVLKNSSLQWGCYLLDFLLNDVRDTILIINNTHVTGAVHNRRLYKALETYLRSPNLPYKKDVILLLARLLNDPSLFPVNEIPDVSLLISISKLVFQEIRTNHMDKLFLSSRLMDLLELSISVTKASKEFKKRIQLDNKDQKQIAIDTNTYPITDISTFENMELQSVLEETTRFISYLLNPNVTNMLSDDVHNYLYNEIFGKYYFIETEHPLIKNKRNILQGNIKTVGATSFRVRFDPRCSISGNSILTIKTYNHNNNDGKNKQMTQERKFTDNKDFPPGHLIEMIGDTFEYELQIDYENNENYDLFGIAFMVSAISLLEEDNKIKSLTKEKMDKFKDGFLYNRCIQWNKLMDYQLIEYVNQKTENNNSNNLKSLDLELSDIKLRPEGEYLRHYSLLLFVSLEEISFRFILLQLFNKLIKQSFFMINMKESQRIKNDSNTYYESVGLKLKKLTHLIFLDIKLFFIDHSIEKTTNQSGSETSSNTGVRVTLDRLKALESRDDREIEPSISECFFAQAFRQLCNVDSKLLRKKIDSKGRLFSVKFKGEEGVDWGGVYRDGTNSMVDDLFSNHFNLFILCPNGQHDTGLNRGMYLPNPSCNSPVAIQMFEFVGILLGISFRTKADFPFSFPSLIWKKLIDEPVDRDDLEGTDALLVQMIDGIRNCENDGIDSDEKFIAAFEHSELYFTTSDSNGKTVELTHDGKTKKVTFSNRIEYCNLAEEYRLYETSVLVKAMKRGLATMVPMQIIRLLTWQEMEMLTCGSPKIDVNFWKKHTRYDGYTEGDETIQLFWKVMGSFTDEQRSVFVKFAWGRSRLPRGKWPQPFKLAKKTGRDSILSLPVAHTCFFSVELPPYSSEEQMRTMLLATINFGLGGILMA